jgi:hypothetical protein
VPVAPKLRRADGSWNPRHGSWYLAVNLPVLPGKKRSQLERGGYPNRNDVEAALDHVKDLFEIPDADDHAGLADLVALLVERTRSRAPLPEVDEVRRRYTSGQQLSRAIGLELNVARLAKIPSAKRPKPLVWTTARVEVWRKGYEKRRAEARARGPHSRRLQVVILVSGRMCPKFLASL